MWSIMNVEDNDLFWATGIGWTNDLDYDLFTEAEKDHFHLPIGGKWVRMV